MIVDDETEIRNIIKEILIEEGYATLTAASAEEANAFLLQHQPDLVFLDIWMPDQDGIDLLKEWSLDKTKNFPVIMISGHATIETAIDATKLGAIGFIEKPISIEKLFDAINSAFSEKTQEQEEDILTYIIKHSKKFSDIFKSTIREEVSQKMVFLVGEDGSGKEGWAKYLHYRKYRNYINFYVLQLNLLAVDQKEPVNFLNELNASLNRLRESEIYIEGIHLLEPSLQDKAIKAIKNNQDDNLSFYISLNDKDIINSFSSMQYESIHIPPLRRYLHDVPELLDICVDFFNKKEGLNYRRFSLAAQNMLTKYPWPGNIRQLIDMVHALLGRKDKEIINVEEIEETLTLQGPKGNLLIESNVMTLSMKEAKQQFERAFLVRQLELVGGKISELSRRVDMERTNLYRKLQSLGIEYKKKK
tara:strand:- start:1545 stop:2798 length:1254 start_codon:yes stop_codon:yes gene_type:complete